MGEDLMILVKSFDKALANRANWGHPGQTADQSEYDFVFHGRHEFYYTARDHHQRTHHSRT